jgi:hypothetical protein
MKKAGAEVCVFNCPACLQTLDECRTRGHTACSHERSLRFAFGETPPAAEVADECDLIGTR